MSLLTQDQRQRLLQNGQNRDCDHFPVVRLYMPHGGVQWLLSELDPDDPSIAFGLCDLGYGYPELETVSLSEIDLISSGLVQSIEYDHSFVPYYPISVYARAARLAGKITFDSRLLSLSVPCDYIFGGPPKKPQP